MLIENFSATGEVNCLSTMAKGELANALDIIEAATDLKHIADYYIDELIDGSERGFTLPIKENEQNTVAAVTIFLTQNGNANLNIQVYN
jgi:hypothetical protein